MVLAVFIVGLVVVLILDRQALRHEVALKGAYEQLGLELPPRKPKPPHLEALLNVILGVILAAASGFIVLTMMMHLDREFTREVGELAAAVLGTGVAMVVLGLRGLKGLREYEKQVQ